MYCDPVVMELYLVGMDLYPVGMDLYPVGMEGDTEWIVVH